jgi:hypothetical protein
MSKGSFKVYSVQNRPFRKQKTHPGVPEMGSGAFRAAVSEAVNESVSQSSLHPTPSPLPVGQRQPMRRMDGCGFMPEVSLAGFGSVKAAIHACSAAKRGRGVKATCRIDYDPQPRLP